LCTIKHSRPIRRAWCPIHITRKELKHGQIKETHRDTAPKPSFLTDSFTLIVRGYCQFAALGYGAGFYIDRRPWKRPPLSIRHESIPGPESHPFLTPPIPMRRSIDESAREQDALQNIHKG